MMRVSELKSMGGRVQVRSPSPHVRKSYSNGELNLETKTDVGCRNKVMVVVDSSIESNGALQWALDHTVQNQDTIILIHVAISSKLGCKSSGEVNQRAYESLCSIKKNLQIKRPEVKVEIEVRQANEKGPMIVEAAKQQRVSLLVLGHRKQSMMWTILQMWVGKRNKIRALDYCIQNANCMTIAVRRKNKQHGGYLITTKRHKNFWLLA